MVRLSMKQYLRNYDWDFCLGMIGKLEFNVIDSPTKTARTANKIIDEPIVPKFKPPFSRGFVSKTPKVAPNGRVNTNAAQNSNT